MRSRDVAYGHVELEPSARVDDRAHRTRSPVAFHSATTL
jgi:hypothetical protein